MTDKQKLENFLTKLNVSFYMTENLIYILSRTKENEIICHFDKDENMTKIEYLS